MKKKKIIKLVILSLLAIGWMVCIYKLSGTASTDSNGNSVGIISIFIEDSLEITNNYGITDSHPTDEKIQKASQLLNKPMRKVIHASVYFVLCFFVLTFLCVCFDHKWYIWCMLAALLVCACFAAGDEIHQLFVDGRTGQILDVLIDTAGAFVGSLFYSTYQIVYINGVKNGKREIEENQYL